MKLGDLKPAIYALNYGEAVLHLRYDLAAFLKIEEAGHDYKDVFHRKITKATLAIFLQAGLKEDIGTDRIYRIISAAPSEVWKHCREAVLLALPQNDPLTLPDAEPSSGEGLDWKRLRMLICDEMGKPEEFFWDSTLRELTERWTIYAVSKGYTKPPQKAVRVKDMTQEEAEKWLTEQGI